MKIFDFLLNKISPEVFLELRKKKKKEKKWGGVLGGKNFVFHLIRSR
jgi:hypothetical protein